MQKLLTVTEKSLKDYKNYCRLIGRKFYDIKVHVRSSPSIGFKWEIGCTVPKNSNKSDVRG